MGQLVFQATLGGQVNLVGPNTASTYNINVPAIAGNMVTTGDTGTVTNTMCATSVYTAPGTIGSGTPNTGAFTTLTTTSTINGITVGKGAGSVSSNTAVGASALASGSQSGTLNTAVGSNALAANTTGSQNTAIGSNNSTSNTTGSFNTFVGQEAFYNNTTGNYNTGVGRDALANNTIASYNTAVGYQAGYNENGTTGVQGAYNTFIGYRSGYNQTTGYANTLIGHQSGLAITTGADNTFVGVNSGGAITTGSKNTIIGEFSGNAGGLNITASSNNIVLSDGDGNPWGYYKGSNGVWYLGLGGTSSSNGAGGIIILNGSTGSGYQPIIQANANGTTYWYVGTKGNIDSSTSTYLQCMNTSGGVYLNGASATSWTAVSDETRKIIIEPITDAANKVATLRTVIGRLKTDDETVRRPYLIAQDVQAVLPEAVSENEDKEGPVLGLSYTEVIPLLVAAIKELKAEFDAYKEAHP